MGQPYRVTITVILPDEVEDPSNWLYNLDLLSRAFEGPSQATVIDIQAVLLVPEPQPTNRQGGAK